MFFFIILSDVLVVFIRLERDAIKTRAGYIAVIACLFSHDNFEKKFVLT